MESIAGKQTAPESRGVAGTPLPFPCRRHTALFHQFIQITAITVIIHGSGLGAQRFLGNPAVIKGYLLQAGYLEPLVVLQSTNEHGSIQKGIVRARIQPRITARQFFHAQQALRYS